MQQEDPTPHGHMVTVGQWQHSRRCLVCKQGYHGPLYLCEHYPPEIKEEITRIVDNTRRKMVTPEWEKEQLDRGVSPLAIAIHKMFMGVG